MRFEKRTSIALAAAMILLIAGGAWAHYYLLHSHKQELAALGRQIQTSQEENLAAAQWLRQHEELSREMHQFSRQVPVDADLPALLDSISRLMAGQSVTDREVAMQTTVAGQYLNRTPVAMTFAGSFDTVVAVLEQIETADGLARIDRMSARRPPGEPQRPLRVQIDFSVFAKNPEEFAQWIDDTN